MARGTFWENFIQNNPHAKYFFIGIAEIHFVSIQTIIQDYFRIAMCKISFTPIS